ncbi:hypothetical protein HP15_3436 [Marinobacter adhaerens HP15]|uniref:Uncharacterized protein n=1 Tax=Marinobacter adhaerens (strain DSM 23420 / HP15) TaxID=225937 RepID=E4PFD0_MARAH|nr:hypothetical protein HP15_3436 [Marinobacter adhaerens HP15]
MPKRKLWRKAEYLSFSCSLFLSVKDRRKFAEKFETGL